MKNHRTLPCLLGLDLGFAAAMATVPSAHAAELNVGGSITPQACTLSLDEEGQINLGEINLQDIHPQYGLDLPEKEIKASVRCQSTTAFGLHFSDTARDDGSTADSFHLISGNDSARKLGTYQAFLSDGLADGRYTRFMRRRNDGGALSGLSAIRSNDRGYSIVINSNQHRAEHTTFSIRLTPSLVAGSNFDATQDVALAGQMTVELSYL